MATGESFRSLAFQFRICHQWISVTVKQVLASIVKNMFDVLPQPTENQLKQNAEIFYNRWNYPNCVGAIDGKHVRIKCPAESGSSYFNYKDYYSMVLLAIVDADCKYLAIDVGSYGREGDAGIYLKSNFGKQIRSNQFNIPPPTALPSTNIILPHVILGDEAFALHENLMKSYPKDQSNNDKQKTIYNYRHSRARRTSENTFGIMASYFRVFHVPIMLQEDTIDHLVTSACILHNIMRTEKILTPQQKNWDDMVRLPKDNLVAITPGGNGRPPKTAAEVRENFKNYFNGPGAVSWQNDRFY